MPWVWWVERYILFFMIYKTWKTQSTDISVLPLRYMWNFNQQISLYIVFIKQNSLKSDLILTPYLFHVFQDSYFPGFWGSRFFLVPAFQSSAFSDSSFFKGPVFQGLGPGFRSNRIKHPQLRITHNTKRFLGFHEHLEESLNHDLNHGLFAHFSYRKATR